MLVATMPRPHQFTHAAFRNGAPAIPESHSPRQNQLLAALPFEAYQRLLPHLVPVSLPRGLQLHTSGEAETHLYFITAGIVSRSYGTRDGLSTGFSLTGNEGAVGLSLFMGGGGAPVDVTVVSPGHAYRLRADHLREEFTRSGSLWQLLLRYAMALIVQSGQTAACNRHHSVAQQLSRALLACSDKLGSGEIAMTQETFAEMLGVRREGVTEAAGSLRRLGIISYCRGQIRVQDRARLEAHACECYGVVKREYARLLPGWRESDLTSRALQTA